MKKIVLNLLLFAVLIFALPFTALLVPPGKIAAAAPSSPPINNTVASSQATSAAPAFFGAELLILDEGTGEVLKVSAREYIIGAIAAEMPVSWPDEALKAQGIAAYSYALALKAKASPEDPALKGAYFKANPSARLGYVTDAVAKLMWQDKYAQNRARLETIADSIASMLITYDGAPALACYHAISSGATENAENVWGTAVPYLISVPSPADKQAVDYEVKRELTTSQIKEAVAMNLAGVHLQADPALWFTNIVLTPSGYVKELTLGGAKVKGNDIRNMLKLRSAAFTIDYKDNVFTFTSRGYGHGVGMSQYGACSMARQGKSCAEILSAYYPGTHITTVK